MLVLIYLLSAHSEKKFIPKLSPSDFSSPIYMPIQNWYPPRAYKRDFTVCEVIRNRRVP